MRIQAREAKTVGGQYCRVRGSQVIRVVQRIYLSRLEKKLLAIDALAYLLLFLTRYELGKGVECTSARHMKNEPETVPWRGCENRVGSAWGSL
ncbi:hypothetical protein CEXT_257491 [Caerostris extrusa]|uniref:Uncharacterized protein n=1 Tax=Caerostris extrusa TaxID=172846 RepID=A0AAV4S7H0_CAEEX|nr:hypothetical protein CEXT_257491 [Caerostris extrusa]